MGLKSGENGERPCSWVFAMNCEMIFFRGVWYMYTERPLFSRRTAAEYRQTIKGRLRHMRKLCNLSQAQAAKCCGVARSTWQAWENPARDALPDAAQLAAVADAARIEPAAALEWLIGGAERKQL